MKKIDFRGRKVLITGASSGIGRALSKEFAARGAHLALGSLPDEKNVLKEWAAELESRYEVVTVKPS
ncbi:MAG TPA: SDR family NAD(P)-dependent oxidoreductase, partial [Deltaproteobacteria bacterium]|nr:SDR family NAD(P)-dependent oxidoreductase [Deltaproteobacteria bacterium]